MQISVVKGIPYYIGKRGCQCECGCLDIEYHVNEEMDEWYECVNCRKTGDKYDFTCNKLPDGLIIERIL